MKDESIVSRYNKFVKSNAEVVGNIESTLRSLSYVIPGI